MSINDRIITNLENLFLSNYEEIKHPSLGQWLDLLKAENQDVFSINEQKVVKFYDIETLNNFEKAKENSRLKECYEKAIELSFNETEIINQFSKDLRTSFKEIKKGIRPITDSKIQIILLTYDYEPYAWISGFGEGNYPILEKPKDFDFNYKKDFFEILGRVDYSKVWNNLIKLQDYLEEAEIYDDVFDTEFYQNLRNCYIFKTYLFLNKAFSKVKEELFNSLSIKKPLLIYGHEHECVKMNIYCYE